MRAFFSYPSDNLHPRGRGTVIQENTGRRRVLLKLSGEAFGGGQLGVNPDVVSQIAQEIAAAVDRVEISIVVGGGNFFRG